MDAVLSEDVDTMMFGCSVSLRCWTSEGGRSGKTPTHVTMYTAESTKKNAGLDRQGMILVALLSGGDYDTEGLAHCGPKIACEAARAGFGQGLCQLAEDDSDGWATWREKLQHELHTNESRFFKQKHKTITIPETFPGHKTLSCYKRPTVSCPEKVARLRETIKWEKSIDVPRLRAFVAEAFDWTYLIGAYHFIKGFAPVLLTHKLLASDTKCEISDDDLEAKAIAEAQYVTAIHVRRHHWNTDGCPELRISYVPANIVGLDLSSEEDFSRPESTAEDPEADGAESDQEENASFTSPIKRRGRSTYDPSQPEKIWVSETIVKLGVPLLVETWEEDMRNPKKFASRKARDKITLARTVKGTTNGAMDKYVKVIKQVGGHEQPCKDVSGTYLKGNIPPMSICATAPDGADSKVLDENVKSNARVRSQKYRAIEKTPKAARQLKCGRDGTNPPSPCTETINPWTLAKRPSDTYCYRSPTRYSALGIYAPNDRESRETRYRRGRNVLEQGDADHSLVFVPSTSETPRAKHFRTLSPTSDLTDEHDNRPLDNVTLRVLRQRGTSKLSPKEKQSPCQNDSDASSVTQLKRPVTIQERRATSLILKHPPSMQRHEALINLSKVDEKEGRPEPFDPLDADREWCLNHSVRQASESGSASEEHFLPSPPIMFPTDSLAGNNPLMRALPRRGSRALTSRFRDDAATKLVILRESLDGAWKRIEPWEVTIGKDAFTGVEVLDMTGGEEL